MLDAEYLPPPATATSSGPRCAGPVPSAWWTACSSACRRYGTRRSCSRCPRGSTSTARRAWAPSARPSSTGSGCAGSARCTAPTPTGVLEDDDEVAVAPCRRRARVPGPVRLDGRHPRDARRGGVRRGRDGAGGRHRPGEGQGDVLRRPPAPRSAGSPATRSTSDCAPGSRGAGCSASATTRSPCLRLVAHRARGGHRAGSPDVDAATHPLLGGRAALGGAGRGTAPARHRPPTRSSRRCSTRCASTRTATAACSWTARCSPRWRDNAATAVGVDVSPWAHQTALERERRHRGLLEPDQVDGWLEERGLSRADLPAVARRLAVLRWAQRGASRLGRRRDGAHGSLRRRLRASSPRRAARKRDVARLASDHRTPTRPTTARSSSGTSASSSARRFPSRSTPGRQAHGWGRVDRPPPGAPSGVVVPASCRRRRRA